MATQQDDEDETAAPSDAETDDKSDDSSEDSEADDDSSEDSEADDDSSEASAQDDDSDGSGLSHSSTQISPPSSPQAGDEKQQAIKDFLAKQYAAAGDNSGVKGAIADSQRQNLIANIGQSLQQMATSRAVANGAKQDDSVWKNLREEGAQGVQQAQATRQQAIQDFFAKNQLGRQAVVDAQTAKVNQVKNDANDPTSKQSQIARHIWETANPGMNLAQDPNWKSLSAANMSLVKDPIDLKARLDERATAAKQHADWMAASIDQKAAATSAKTEAAGDKADAASDKATAATTKAQGANYVKMNSEVNGAGRAPPDIKQALKDRQSIDKANELFKGDLNHLSKSQAALAAGELEKIATGGSGTEAGRRGLDPDTYREQWAAFKNKFVGPNGSVDPANLGPFLQQQKDYLQGLKTVTDEKLHAYQRGVHDTYLDAGQITPELSDKFAARHPELFPERQKQEPAPAQNVSGSNMGPGTAQAGATPTPPPADMVQIQAPSKRNPDGSIVPGEKRFVKKEAVDKYLKQGGSVVP